MNSDDVEIVCGVMSPISLNTYSYCLNNPINSVDIGGQLAAQLIARIILGIIIGFVVQLLCDCIECWYKVYVRNLNAKLKPHIVDYMSSMFTWATICVTPNGKLATFLMTFVPLVIKHGWKLLIGRFNWKSLLQDLIVAVVAYAISSCIDRNTQKKLAQIRRKFSGQKNAVKKIAKSSQNLKGKIKVMGIKINLNFTISTTILQTIYNAIK